MNPLERRLWVADGLTHSADGLGPDTPDTSSAIQTRCINSVTLQALPSGPPGVRWKRIGHPHGQDPPCGLPSRLPFPPGRLPHLRISDARPVTPAMAGAALLPTGCRNPGRRRSRERSHRSFMGNGWGSAAGLWPGCGLGDKVCAKAARASVVRHLAKRNISCWMVTLTAVAVR